MNEQMTLRTSPSRASYGVFFVIIVETNCRIIKSFHSKRIFACLLPYDSVALFGECR